VEEIDAGKEDEDQHPAGSGHGADEGMARNGCVPEEPRLDRKILSFAIAQLHQ